jgi:hypothetical protein
VDVKAAGPADGQVPEGADGHEPGHFT